MSDEELLETYEQAVRSSMDETYARTGFASNMARESIVAGLRAVANAGASRPVSDYDKLIAEAREGHVPKEVFFGYPVEPGETVGDDYVETCMCGERFPCQAIQLADALEAMQENRDEFRAAWNALGFENDRLEAGRERVKDFVTRHYLDTQMGQRVLALLDGDES